MKKKEWLLWIEIVCNVVSALILIYCVLSWSDVVINNMGGTIAWWNLFRFIVR